MFLAESVLLSFVSLFDSTPNSKIRCFVEQDIPLLKLSVSSICLKCAIAVGSYGDYRWGSSTSWAGWLKSMEAPQDGLAQKRLFLCFVDFDQSLPLSSSLIIKYDVFPRTGVFHGNRNKYRRWRWAHFNQRCFFLFTGSKSHSHLQPSSPGIRTCIKLLVCSITSFVCHRAW